MNELQGNLLFKIAGMHALPDGATSLRIDGKSRSISSTDGIAITPKQDGSGFEMRVAENTPHETAYIPVIISNTGVVERVYNDFYIGSGADVTIIAGCGIHNDGDQLAQHDGVHTFHVGNGAQVRYVESHFGSGNGSGMRVLNPVTKAYLGEGALLEMETTQIEGVSDTDRVTEATLGENASLIVHEKLMTSGNQLAQTRFEVVLNGSGSSALVVSRSVAKGNSKQVFYSKISGNNACAGRTECDAILMDNATVYAVPEVFAGHLDASLAHEAAIGRIAGDQLIKLMTLGLTEEQAEEQIVAGFMK